MSPAQTETPEIVSNYAECLLACELKKKMNTNMYKYNERLCSEMAGFFGDAALIFILQNISRKF